MRFVFALSVFAIIVCFALSLGFGFSLYLLMLDLRLLCLVYLVLRGIVHTLIDLGCLLIFADWCVYVWL